MADLVQLGSFPSEPVKPPVFETDPVCKMKVMPDTAAGSHEYKNKKYYFCATRCLERFRAEPERFVSPAKAEPPRTLSATYVCPMHPEVRQVGPGACPKCGM